MKSAIQFIELFVLALLAGTMFGIWLGFNPAGLSPSTYVEQQQGAIRALNTALPAMGAICILLTIALAVLTRNDKARRSMLVGAALLLCAAALITRFQNQPINAVVMSWSASAPPANWTELRDTWWQWHVARTLAALGALAITLLVALRLWPTPP